MNYSNSASIYFPVESVVGLGHFNRCGRIVRELVGGGHAVTVASGTFVDPHRFFKGANLIEMPTYISASSNGAFSYDREGRLTPHQDFNRQAWSAQRTQAALSNILKLKPDVVISEFWPFDRENMDSEMTATLNLAKSFVPSVLRIASVRDVLDRPNSEESSERHIARHKRDQWAVSTLNEHFNILLVHGDSKFVPLEETLPNFADIRCPVAYTGYVTDDLPKRGKVAADGPILVSCGSGADGEELMMSFLTSWRHLLRRRETDREAAFAVNRPVHIVTGPRFYEGAYREISDWAEELNVEFKTNIKVDRYRSDYTQLLAGAAFSVSLAGYNVTLETLALGVPGILVPKYAFMPNGTLRWSTEQAYRLERLQQKGMATYAMPEEVQNSQLFARRLVREICEQLAENNPKRARLDFSGAQRTGEIINDLLCKRSLKVSLPISPSRQLV